MSERKNIEEKYAKQIKKYERRKKLDKVTKKNKRNKEPKRPRHRDWVPDDVASWDEFEVTTEERMMPLGEHSRRRELEQLAFENNEPTPADQTATGQPARVVAVSGGRCQVAWQGQIMACHLRGSLKVEETGYTNLIAVGDEVLVNEDGHGSGVVEAVLPRRNVLARPDVFHRHRQQVIVANVDQLLIVASWREPQVWPELIDRYLITAERNQLQPIICLNKIDLADQPADYQPLLTVYQTLGYQTLTTSAKTGTGISQLQTLLDQQTTVLAGLSGVGKSTLLIAVQPDLQLRTGVVSESSGEGQHTTTQATWLQLATGGAVVDTPGIREFGLSGLLPAELAAYFPEIVALAGGCRFNDCTHLTEPACAVQAAVEQGQIAATRYHSYQQIYASLVS